MSGPIHDVFLKIIAVKVTLTAIIFRYTSCIGPLIYLVSASEYL